MFVILHFKLPFHVRGWLFYCLPSDAIETYWSVKALVVYLILWWWQHRDTFATFTETAIEPIGMIVCRYKVVVQGVDRLVVQCGWLFGAQVVVMIRITGAGHFNNGKLSLRADIKLWFR